MKRQGDKERWKQSEEFEGKTKEEKGSEGKGSEM